MPYSLYEKNLAPVPQFTDPLRREKIAVAYPEIRRALQEYREEQNIPGLAFGIIVDDELAYADAFGLRHVETNAPVTRDTVFRIASMSKSFVAMAILKLRDEKKLRLDDPVSTYIPEWESLTYPTRDSGVLTLRHLLTMSAGFPEDNPWGDRQMAIAGSTFSEWLRGGIPFSNAPNMTYEYSNYGFSILGRVITRVSGIAFQKYIAESILEPLGMKATTWDKTRVPPEQLAHGYRFEDDVFKPEPILPDGSFAAMAGLFTTIPDFARYMSFLLDAYPPRDDPEHGPVSRATAREMQELARYDELVPYLSSEGAIWHAVHGYGFGLAVWHDQLYGHGVAHGGGLPGYGSYYYLLPDHGVGIAAFTNKTYARIGRVFPRLLEIVARTGALQPRKIFPAPVLLELRAAVQRWIENGDDAALSARAADNFLLDHDLPHRRAQLHEIRAELGAFLRVGEFEALNALRGKWSIECERGALDILLTLAPTMPPTIQMVNLVARAKDPR